MGSGCIALRDPSAVSFFDLSSLRSMEAPPSELLKCPFCELPLPTVRDADQHIRKVEFEIRAAVSSFVTLSHRAHRYEVHLSFGCSECGRRFMEVGQVQSHFERNRFCCDAMIRVMIPRPHQMSTPPRQTFIQQLIGLLKGK